MGKHPLPVPGAHNPEFCVAPQLTECLRNRLLRPPGLPPHHTAATCLLHLKCLHCDLNIVIPAWVFPLAIPASKVITKMKKDLLDLKHSAEQYSKRPVRQFELLIKSMTI